MDLYRRDQSASDILDRSVMLLRKNFRRLLVVSIALQILFVSIATLLRVTASQIIMTAVLNTLNLALAVALMTAMLAPTYMGILSSPRGALYRARRALPAYFLSLAPAILTAVLIGNLTIPPGDFFTLGLAFALIVSRSALYLFFLFPIAFSVFENYRWRANWWRIARLARGSLRHIIKTFFALGAAYVLIGGVINILITLTYAIFLTSLLRRVGITSFIMENIVASISGIFGAPFIASAFTVLYYDLCCRQEGLDLETRLQELTLEPSE